MTSTKHIQLLVSKPYDYYPIPVHERRRIKKLVNKAILEIANSFDGPSKISIHITAKGNA